MGRRPRSATCAASRRWATAGLLLPLLSSLLSLSLVVAAVVVVSSLVLLVMVVLLVFSLSLSFSLTAMKPWSA